MVLPRKQMHDVQQGNPDSGSRETESVHPVVLRDTDSVLPDRTPPTVSERPDSPHEELHLALVVPDLKSYGVLRKHSWLIKPPNFKGLVKVHVLLQKPKTTEQELIFAHALTALGLVDPATARLQYPEEIELGWEDDTAPINL